MELTKKMNRRWWGIKDDYSMHNMGISGGTEQKRNKMKMVKDEWRNGIVHMYTHFYIQTFVMGTNTANTANQTRKLLLGKKMGIFFVEGIHGLAVDEEVGEHTICCKDCILWAVNEESMVESTGSRHEGHVNDFISHSSTHSWWNECMQGRNRILSPGSKSIIQMAHSLLVISPRNTSAGICSRSPRIRFFFASSSSFPCSCACRCLITLCW